jgi:outer membrane receptor protein involved in Fe transport
MSELRYTGTIALIVALGAGGELAAQGTPGGRTGPQAPQAAGQIRGTVVDAATGQPIRSASAEVRSAADSSLVNGALTGADGAFRIEGVRPGRYYLRVTALGHQASTRPGIAVSAEAPVATLGTIRLAASAVQLEGVTVTAARREAALAPDRNTYTLRDMPAAAGGNAVDALRNVPSVEVDIDGRVSLRGNENVVVQINGRPSPMRGEQLGAFLAQLPANMVDRVEVIPNPSAKFDPEGMAGIVNVVLRQNTDLGTSGGITAGGGTTGQVNLSGNVGFQKGPLTLFGNYGFMRDDRETTGFTFRENRYLTPLTYLEQDAAGAFAPISHTLNTSAEYKLASRDVLHTSLLLSTRSSDRNDLNEYREFGSARELLGIRDRRTDEEGNELRLDYVLGYRHTIRPRQNEFATELRFNRNGEDELTRYTEQAMLPDGNAADELPFLERQGNDERTRNWTLTADYTRPLGERVRLETGYRGTLRQLDSDFTASLFSYASDAYEVDASRTNAFAYDETVHAGYGVLAGTVGSFDLQGGLRLERATSEFDLATTGESFENSYNSFFPSALVAFNLDDSRQLKASYSKRVERPRTQQLNPFGRVEDPLNVFRGNPFLKPEYTHSFEVGFQQSGDLGTIQLTPFYRHTTDAVRRFTTVDDATGVATTTFQNVATTDSYGADFNTSIRRGRLTGFGGLSAFRQVTDASNVGAGVGSDAFGWSARMNATFKITPRLDAQGFLMYRAPMATEQGRVSGRQMFNLALRQKLMGDRASVSLRVVDPFNTMRFRSLTDDERFYQETERRMGARGVFLSFSYNFGQQPRVRREQQPERGGDEEEVP